jgi:CNT family concentrative nucleoside transporter
MITPTPGSPSPAPDSTSNDDAPPPEHPLPPTPWRWRFAIAAIVAAVGGAAYLLHGTLTEPVRYRFQAGAGIICFLGIAACFSKSLQSVSRKTLLWGIGLQVVLAVAVIHSQHVQAVFQSVGTGIKALIMASDKGAEFVFGSLAKVDGPSGFVFAFKALPPIIFVSALQRAVLPGHTAIARQAHGSRDDVPDGHERC